MKINDYSKSLVISALGLIFFMLPIVLVNFSNFAYGEISGIFRAAFNGYRLALDKRVINPAFIVFLAYLVMLSVDLVVNIYCYFSRKTIERKYITVREVFAVILMVVLVSLALISNLLEYIYLGYGTVPMFLVLMFYIYQYNARYNFKKFTLKRRKVMKISTLFLLLVFTILSIYASKSVGNFSSSMTLVEINENTVLFNTGVEVVEMDRTIITGISLVEGAMYRYSVHNEYYGFFYFNLYFNKELRLLEIIVTT